MKFKLLLGMLLASNSVFAGKIIQNIEWNQLTQNETGQAVAQSQRNLVSLGIYNSKQEYEDIDSEQKTAQTGALLYLSNDLFNLEASGFLSKDTYDYSTDDDEYEYKNLRVRAGKRIHNLSLGINTVHYNTDGGNGYEIGTGATYHINDLIAVGGGVNRFFDNEGDKDAFNYYAGIGFTKKDFFAFELNLLMHPEKKEVQNKTSKVEAQGAINLGRFQLIPRLSSSVMEYQSDDKDTTTESELKAEFKINEMFFVGALLSGKVVKFEDDVDSDDDETTTTSNFGISGRFKTDKFQILALLESGKEITDFEDTTTDIEANINSFTLFASYFF